MEIAPAAIVAAIALIALGEITSGVVGGVTTQGIGTGLVLLAATEWTGGLGGPLLALALLVAVLLSWNEARGWCDELDSLELVDSGEQEGEEADVAYDDGSGAPHDDGSQAPHDDRSEAPHDDRSQAPHDDGSGAPYDDDEAPYDDTDEAPYDDDSEAGAPDAGEVAVAQAILRLFRSRFLASAALALSVVVVASSIASVVAVDLEISGHAAGTVAGDLIAAISSSLAVVLLALGSLAVVARVRREAWASLDAQSDGPDGDAGASF
ncbi:MAG TPA: hypothetical protein VMD59_14015 [Acidimicrobiales bacterium]|nr:hypothetical protein [Acidimicrobiales bacterium]